eukprot:TRINITY_DN1267_c0_g1_i4.p1 TRINITY_DN1267_c0_g1~~TRINITY_DN1267_c0_g1_i4.p1  ORF type:complete len:187 (-),score=37.98 TRINITY_DN1267_c0_g1_i4:1131-1691(-)
MDSDHTALLERIRALEEENQSLKAEKRHCQPHLVFDDEMEVDFLSKTSLNLREGTLKGMLFGKLLDGLTFEKGHNGCATYCKFNKREVPFYLSVDVDPDTVDDDGQAWKLVRMNFHMTVIKDVDVPASDVSDKYIKEIKSRSPKMEKLEALAADIPSFARNQKQMSDILSVFKNGSSNSKGLWVSV